MKKLNSKIGLVVTKTNAEDGILESRHSSWHKEISGIWTFIPLPLHDGEMLQKEVTALLNKIITP